MERYYANADTKCHYGASYYLSFIGCFTLGQGYLNQMTNYKSLMSWFVIWVHPSSVDKEGHKNEIILEGWLKFRIQKLHSISAILIRIYAKRICRVFLDAIASLDFGYESE